MASKKQTAKAESKAKVAKDPVVNSGSKKSNPVASKEVEDVKPVDEVVEIKVDVPNEDVEEVVQDVILDGSINELSDASVDESQDDMQMDKKFDSAESGNVDDGAADKESVDDEAEVVKDEFVSVDKPFVDPRPAPKKLDGEAKLRAAMNGNLKERKAYDNRLK